MIEVGCLAVRGQMIRVLTSAPGFWSWIQIILRDSWKPLLMGMGQTLLIATISTALGLGIGMLVALVQTLPQPENRARAWVLRFVKGLLTAYVEVFRGTPMMVQAAFLYYGSALLWGVELNLWMASILIVSINTGAYLAETVRGGLLSIDPGQKEAAHALGFSHRQQLRYILLPQALRAILPQIGNNLIINIKDTCVLSIIGVSELFYTVKSVAGKTYAFFPAYATGMVAYFIMTFLCARLLRRLERRWNRPQDYQLVLQDPLVTGEGMVSFPDQAVKQGERLEVTGDV